MDVNIISKRTPTKPRSTKPHFAIKPRSMLNEPSPAEWNIHSLLFTHRSFQIMSRDSAASQSIKLLNPMLLENYNQNNQRHFVMDEWWSQKGESVFRFVNLTFKPLFINRTSKIARKKLKLIVNDTNKFLFFDSLKFLINEIQQDFLIIYSLNLFFWNMGSIAFMVFLRCFRNLSLRRGQRNSCILKPWLIASDIIQYLSQSVNQAILRLSTTNERVVKTSCGSTK